MNPNFIIGSISLLRTIRFMKCSWIKISLSSVDNKIFDPNIIKIKSLPILGLIGFTVGCVEGLLFERFVWSPIKSFKYSEMVLPIYIFLNVASMIK